MTAMNNVQPRDLVGEMLPTLCEKFIDAQDGEFGVGEQARHLFDALEALGREQKIRNLRKLLTKIDELEEVMQKAALARDWRLSTLLTTLYFGEISVASPSLEVICMIATRQEELSKKAGAGGQGVEEILKFGGEVRGAITKVIDEELRVALVYGRSSSASDAAGVAKHAQVGKGSLLRVIEVPAGVEVDLHEKEMADLVVIDGVVVKSRWGKCSEVRDTDAR
jgi:hypothetical protein